MTKFDLYKALNSDSDINVPNVNVAQNGFLLGNGSFLGFLNIKWQM